VPIAIDAGARRVSSVETRDAGVDGPADLPPLPDAGVPDAAPPLRLR
jgi:hypothetical protein